MNKKEWEVFWEWVTGEHDYYYDYNEDGVGSWLEEKKDEWERFEPCPKCKTPGLKKMTETYDGYDVGTYDQCQNCMEHFNKANLWDDAKGKIIVEIEKGYKSPRDIRYLIERFNLQPDDTSKLWVKEVIIEFKKEVEAAKEFARVSKAERDAWEKEVKNRLERVVERDEKNE